MLQEPKNRINHNLLFEMSGLPITNELVAAPLCHQLFRTPFVRPTFPVEANVVCASATNTKLRSCNSSSRRMRIFYTACYFAIPFSLTLVYLSANIVALVARRIFSLFKQLRFFIVVVCATFCWKIGRV